MPSDRCSVTWAFRSRRYAALVLLEHEQARHAIAAILIEHETIDREQFERLLQSEPGKRRSPHIPGQSRQKGG
jgi:hypothetical protein